MHERRPSISPADDPVPSKASMNYSGAEDSGFEMAESAVVLEAVT